MTKPYNSRLLMMVAQKPFEHEWNQFCKLMPVVYSDGTPAPVDDFPNDGEIWWMLTAQSQQLAEPGRLVAGMIEDAIRYDPLDPTASRFQAVRESLAPITPQDAVEVLDISTEQIQNLEEVVSERFKLSINFRPASVVLIRWGDKIYGPFKATAEEVGPDDGSYAYEVNLRPKSTTLVVCSFAESEFVDLVGSDRVTIAENVSLSDHDHHDPNRQILVRHELVLNPGYQRLLESASSSLTLEPLDQKLNRLAKRFLVRSKRQELRSLLAELEIRSTESDEAGEVSEMVRSLRQDLEGQDAALDYLVQAVLDAGLLGEDRIERAERAYAEDYVREHSAALQTQIEENAREVRGQMRKLEAELTDLDSTLARKLSEQQARLDAEAEGERERVRREIAQERELLDQEQEQLRENQEVLQKNLERVTEEMKSAGNALINQFLALNPLIQLAVPSAPPQPREEQRGSGECFSLPQYVTRPSRLLDAPLGEDEFFERFLQVVQSAGFDYRDIDLRAFHLSVKGGDLTVVGGLSGTGKSSLPLLYTRALHGEEVEEREGCLMVNVSPSWMEPRDLVGHLNTLDGRFYPAESRVFETLVYAQEEYQRRESASPLYIICLDEMNLAQVEHYFSEFMMVLEREGVNRRLQVFSPESACPECSFLPWASITLPPTVKFVGTVNFDETTRALSDRFLDRVNLLRLPTRALLPSPVRPSVASVGHGRPVTLNDFQSWQRPSVLPAELAQLIDDLRGPLVQLGCPLSPRVYRSMIVFLTTAEPLVSAYKALDLQLAQRVIPKIRSVVSRQQFDATDTLVRLLTESRFGALDESIALLEGVRSAAQDREWLFADEQ